MAVAAPVGAGTAAGTRPGAGTVGWRPGTGTVDSPRSGTAAGTEARTAAGTADGTAARTAAGTVADTAAGTAADTAAGTVRRARSTAAPVGKRAEPPGYCTATVVPCRRADNSAGTTVPPWRRRPRRAWAAAFATGTVVPYRRRTKTRRVFPAWPFRRPPSPRPPQR